MSTIETAAVIPAFNEEGRIGNVIRAAVAANQVDCVVVVDDGSGDNTLNEVHAAFSDLETEKPHAVISPERNLGKTGAVALGVERARSLSNNGLSTLAFLDADSLPIWSRDTLANMKIYQKLIHQALGISKIVLPEEIMDSRNNVFVDLLGGYIDEMVSPVLSGQQAMRSGMYQRNTLTDTFLPHISRHGGHAGNRALSIDLWNRFLAAKEQNTELSEWGLEAGLNTLARTESVSTFIMYGVVNVGSRVKAGGAIRGLQRMYEIHSQAPSTKTRFGRH